MTAPAESDLESGLAATAPSAAGGLGLIDVLVVAAYLATLVAIAWRVRRRSATTDDYFLAGHGIPWWAAACSFLATAISAATFVAVPQKGFSGDFRYLGTNLGALVAVAVVAWLFIPAFFRSGVSTVYGYLGQRYGQGAVTATSWTFLLGRLIASGSRLYVFALALAAIVFPHASDDQAEVAQATFIVIAAALGLGLARVGGLRSVIWTDVAQAILFLGAGAVVVGILWMRIPLEPAAVLDLLDGDEATGQASRLQVFPYWFGGFDPQYTFSVLAIVCGFSLITLGAYGTDQDLAQRMLATRSPQAAARSAVGGVLLGTVTAALFLIIGVLLSLYYGGPEIMGAAAPTYAVDAQTAFPQFIALELPAGLGGLVLAGLTATAVSGLTSEVSSMASVFTADCYRPLRPQRDEAHYLRVGRRGVLAAALALAGFALLCIVWRRFNDQDLIDFVLGVMLFAYTGMVGVFLCALLTKRGSVVTVIAGLLTGIVATGIMWFTPAISDHVAFPWRMLIATVLAFTVCCLARKK